MNIQTADTLPLVCTKCDHGDHVEIKSEEIHCEKCGNYAFVGRKTRWPFVKKDENYSKNYSIACNDCENGAESPVERGHSPMQVAESVAEKPAIIELPANDNQEETMSVKKNNPKCGVEGCKKEGAFHGYCAVHFREEFGIAITTYSKFKLRRGEDPREVAKRFIEAKAKDVIEKKGLKCETKQPVPEKKRVQAKPEAGPEPTDFSQTGKAFDNSGTGLYGPYVLLVDFAPELYDRLTEKAKQEYRTPEQQAAYMIDRALKTVELTVYHTGGLVPSRVMPPKESA